jgi:hypothetical protein
LEERALKSSKATGRYNIEEAVIGAVSVTASSFINISSFGLRKVISILSGAKPAVEVPDEEENNEG